MCGFAGVYYFDKNKSPSQQVLEKMGRSIEHRGPDGMGVHIDGPLGLVHMRLSIIDTSSNANQPMVDALKRHIIAYNGELYNYKSMRDAHVKEGYPFQNHSDTEVMLAEFAKYGIGFLEHLTGMFAFALYEKNRNTLFLARDRVGIKPLYYYKDSEKIIFASEMKAILQYPGLHFTLNEEAALRYFQFLNVPGNLSIYKEVKKLVPGHFLEISGSKITEKKYWELPKENYDLSASEIQSRFESLLDKVVEDHLISDVPVGTFLSGGLDSSVVTALAAKKSKNSIKTFSIVFPNDKPFNAAPYSTAVAKHYHTEHKELELKWNLVRDLKKFAYHCDEPFAISSSLALYYMAKETAKHVKVVLTGDGADEILAGYSRHWFQSKIHNLGMQFPSALKECLLQTSQQMLLNNALFADGFLNKKAQGFVDQFCLDDGPFYEKLMSTFSSTGLSSLLHKDVTAAFGKSEVAYEFTNSPYKDFINRRLYTEMKTSLVDEMIMKVDRMTMAHGLEARVPFLDHRMVELAFQIPGKLKTDGTLGKLPLRTLSKKLLPQSVYERGKMGFNIPLSSWFRGDLKNYITEELTSRSLKDSGLFDMKAIHRLLDEHNSSKLDHSSKIFALLMWKTWSDHKGAA